MDENRNFALVTERSVVSFVRMSAIHGSGFGEGFSMEDRLGMAVWNREQAEALVRVGLVEYARAWRRNMRRWALAWRKAVGV